jgi:hypothetical protein
MLNASDLPDEMSSMLKVLATLNKEGYNTQFKADKKGIVSSHSQKCFKPKDVEIKHFYRFEGESNPDDNSIVYAIETKNGEKGTLIDSYGAYSDPFVEDFIKQVQSITK